MANKPENDDIVSWKRAWDVEEMRNHAGNWSLAADAGMLLYLHKFSQELLTHTHNIQEQLNDVNRETKLTGVRVNNAFNNFIMLANSQFVENRVYDDDVTMDESGTQDKKDIQEKSQEQKEAELIPKITEALTLGLNVVDTAFEKLDINEANSSSEEDNIPLGSDMLLEPKDLYLSRPLPSLIGSVNFMHDDSVGLAEASSDEEEDYDSKEDISSASEVESETANEKREKSSQQKADWSQSETSSESDEDLFAAEESKVSEDEKQVKDNESRTSSQEPGNFLDELSNKFKSSDAASPRQVTQPKYKHKDATTTDDIFCHVQQKSPQRDSDEEDTLFKSKTSHFPKPAQLFDDDDDDDDEGDLFSDLITKSIEKSSTGNKFVKEKSPSQLSAEEVPSTKSILFDGGDESDDELFAVAKSSAKPKPRKQGGLFTEDEKKHEDITENKTTPEKVTKKRVLPGAVSMFGPGVNPVIQSIKQHHSSPTDESVTESDSESDHCSGSMHDTDTSSSGPTDIAAAVTKLPSSGQIKKQGIQILPTPPVSNSGKTELKKSTIKSSAASGGLFDDDEDDLFAAVPSQSNKTTKSTNKPAAVASSLFVDEDEDDLFSSITKSAATKKAAPAAAQSKASTHQVLSLFDDEDDGDDIFSAKSQHKEEVKGVSKQDKKPSKSLSVFDDEDVLFGSPDDDPSVDLFGSSSPLAASKKAPTASAKKATSENIPPSGSTSSSSKRKSPAKDLDLFLDDEDDTEDLFAIRTKPNKTNKHSGNSAERGSTNQQAANKTSTNEEAANRVSAGRDTTNSKSASTEANNTDLFSNKKPAAEQLATKSRVSDDSALTEPSGVDSGLFTSEEDDLFDVKPKSPQTCGTKPAAESEKEKALFLDDEEEDLFADTRKQSSISPSLAKPGMRRTPPESDIKILTADRNKNQTLSEDKHSENQVFGGKPPPQYLPGGVRLPGAVPVLGAVRPSPVPAVKNRDHTNPPSTDVNDASSAIGFDQPMAANTLPSATKARARLAVGRRPPSRRKQTAGATSAVTADQDVADFFSSTASTLAGSDQISAKSGNQSHSTSVSRRSDTDMTLDLPFDVTPKTTSQPAVATASATDVFQSKEVIRDSITDTNTTSTTARSDDIFASGYNTVKPKHNYFPSSIPHLADEPPGGDKTVPPTDDPLLGGSKAKTKSPVESVMPNNSTSQKLTSGILDDDDIFADSILSKPKHGKVAKSTKDGLFGGSGYSTIDDIFGVDDNEDIFGSNSTSTQKVAPPAKGVSSKKADVIFHDDDDLFGTTLKKEVKSSKTESIGKVSTTSTTTTTKKKESGKSLLNIFDDEDDLFAPKAATVQTAGASKTSKQASSKTKALTEDIFADETSNIFDDPLLVTKKQ